MSCSLHGCFSPVGSRAVSSLAVSESKVSCEPADVESQVRVDGFTSSISQRVSDVEVEKSVRVDGCLKVVVGSSSLEVGSQLTCLPDPDFPHAPSPTSTAPTSTHNDTHTAVHTSGRHRTLPSTTPPLCSTACSSPTVHPTQPRALHVPSSTVHSAAPTETRRRLKRRDQVQGPSLPDGWTRSVDGSGQMTTLGQEEREVQGESRDAQSATIVTDGLADEVQCSVRDGQTEVSIVRDEPVPSDAQILYWTLVDDGALPDGFIEDIVRLMESVESAAARQARMTFLDNPEADLFVHNFHRNQRRAATVEKSTADMFAQAVALPPRRYKTRLERTLFSGPTPRKDAEEQERSRWILVLATLLMDTPTPVGQLLKANPSDFQYLGAGRRASTLRALVRYLRNILRWISSARQKSYPSEVDDLVCYLKKSRRDEPCNRGALRNAS